MVYNYLLSPYHNLLSDIFNNGIDAGETKALYNQSITFDLMSLNSFDDNNERVYQLFLPDKRGLKNTSIKYGIAEAIWYRQATRKIDAIVKYGKIWNEMTDSDGNINSNYGYQLENNNNILSNIVDLKTKFDKFGQSAVEFYIANHDNQFSRTDCTCNNKIVVSLSRSDGKLVLDSSVYARSIDVMFGLPYDTFTFNGFMAMIAEELTKLYKGNEDILLSTLTFNVVNIHWYKRDDINIAALNNLTNDVILINHTDTPYTDFRFSYINYSKDDIVNARNDSASKTVTKEVVNYDRSISYLYGVMPKVDVSKGIKSIEELKENISSKINKKDSVALKRLDLVVEYLTNNPSDRKTIIMTDDNDLIYTSYINKKYYVTHYKPIKK